MKSFRPLRGLRVSQSPSIRATYENRNARFRPLRGLRVSQ